jgi:hypothetical protein
LNARAIDLQRCLTAENGQKYFNHYNRCSNFENY